ncbi:MAG: hypothetical protein E7483_06935 [Ruminococcaceae bacterium]|nr:hypothetical protein [Oscillospiraceae bacterium]
MTGRNKKVIIAVVASVAVIAALLTGIVLGRSFEIADALLPERADRQRQEIIVSNDALNIAAAWNNYISADIQQADVTFSMESNILDFEEKLAIRIGKFDGKPITHIRKGGIDAYIYNDKLYIDDQAYFDIMGREFTVEDAQIKEMLGFAYDLVKNGEVNVEKDGDTTVYQLMLTQQQIEQMLADVIDEMDEVTIAVDYGLLEMVLEKDKLKGVYLTCEGEIGFLGMNMELKMSVDVDTQAVENGDIWVPADIMEKIK